MRDALGIGAATGAYALSFGAIATTAGLSTLQTVALSLLLFSGASRSSPSSALVAAAGPPAAQVATGGAARGRATRSTALRLGRSSRARAARLSRPSSSSTRRPRWRSRSRTSGHGAEAFWATGIAIFIALEHRHPGRRPGRRGPSHPTAFGLDAAAPAAFVALLAPRMRRRGAGAVALGAAAGRRSRRCRSLPAGVPVLPGPRSRSPCSSRGGAAMTWAAVLAAAAGCYLLKLAGLSVPERSSSPTRAADRRPAAGGAALGADRDPDLLDRPPASCSTRAPRASPRRSWRSLLRAPFLVVVAAAAALTAALLRLVV